MQMRARSSQSFTAHARGSLFNANGGGGDIYQKATKSGVGGPVAPRRQGTGVIAGIWLTCDFAELAWAPVWGYCGNPAVWHLIYINSGFKYFTMMCGMRKKYRAYDLEQAQRLCDNLEKRGWCCVITRPSGEGWEVRKLYIITARR
jgi:hypothetical protein